MKQTTLLLFVLTVLSAGLVLAQDFRNGIPWEKPAVVTPGETPGAPPSDAIILFDGTNLDQWEGGAWKVEDGVLTVEPGTGAILTKQKFGSCQLHLEFATPPVEDESLVGQARGNSGLFLMNHYELQILDSYECDTYYDGQCGAMYKQFPPYVNACKKPTEWQSYDVVFTRPILRIEDGKVIEVVRPAHITVFQNGVLVQNHFALEGDTYFHKFPEYQPHADREPIQLQDHLNRMQFRNIWIREIPDANIKPEPREIPYIKE